MPRSIFVFRILRVPYPQARFNYQDLMGHIYRLIRDHTYTWSEAFLARTTQLETLFQYLPQYQAALVDAPTDKVSKRQRKTKNAPLAIEDQVRDPPTVRPKPPDRRTRHPGARKAPRGCVFRSGSTTLLASRNGKKYRVDFQLHKCKKGDKCSMIHECNHVKCPDLKNCNGSIDRKNDPTFN